MDLFITPLVSNGITPANITDNQGFKHVCPNGEATYADKGYCFQDSQKTRS